MSDRDRYFETHKFIRDLVHGYINLSDFELKIVDTAAFQRLKDIRQLTCQDVYPCAQHTRFEHSLGVLELTRHAINNLNKNGFINSSSRKKVISSHLEFNTRLAALLHDVGHCPFSHLGETQFDEKEVKSALYARLSDKKFNISEELINVFKPEAKEKCGAVHEQLSCIVILDKYYDLLSNIDFHHLNKQDNVYVDFELIVRCIIGKEYRISNKTESINNSPKNAVIRLINSNIFDMDKLDYIMRDSFYTSIGTPHIDTNRIFKNMYFDKNYEIVFTSKAVPSLQNMIEARDGLYMYVYNHHAVVLSDFMHTYLIRKLSHNADDFLDLIYSEAKDKDVDRKHIIDDFYVLQLGLVPRSYCFSVNAVLQKNRSDSDWISLLNMLYYTKTLYEKDNGDTIKADLNEFIASQISNPKRSSDLKTINIGDMNTEEILKKINNMFQLINQHKNRNFLKPWWKTVFEFNTFIASHFLDDNTRRKLCNLICKDDKEAISPTKKKFTSSEFRSQIAKHVIYITQQLSTKPRYSYVVPLNEGDFFVEQRSTRFFSKDAIVNLNIAVKTNEIIEISDKSVEKGSEYFIKNLTNIIPQKDYSSIYVEEGFYVFSRKSTQKDEKKKKKNYIMLEKIFVFVANELVRRGKHDFITNFCEKNKATFRQNEKTSMEKMYADFLKQL